MTLNLGNKFEAQSTVNLSKAAYLQKNQITINEPVKTHFTVQGVQAYSPQQILAIKSRQERKNNLLQGVFVGLQVYKIDDQIQFTEKPPGNPQLKIKPKRGQKQKLESVKQTPSSQRKIIKPSIRNEMGRTNRNLNKIGKNLQKKQDYEEKLAQLTKKYKEHFGQDEKPKKKAKKNESKEVSVNNDQEKDDNEQNQGQIGLQQDQGDQFVPTFKKNPQKSVKTMAKTGKNDQDEEKDQNFQEVQWQKPTSKKSSQSIANSSRVNASTYSQKLGNAVNFLFD